MGFFPLHVSVAVSFLLTQVLSLILPPNFYKCSGKKVTRVYRLETLHYRSPYIVGDLTSRDNAGRSNSETGSLTWDRKHRIFLCYVDSCLQVKGMVSLVCVLQNGRNILHLLQVTSHVHLRSWLSLLWRINQGLGSHFQLCAYRSLFFLSILRMVSSLQMNAYYPSKWKCVELDSSLLICNKNHCQRDRNILKFIK